jgi:hypothetical protein
MGNGGSVSVVWRFDIEQGLGVEWAGLNQPLPRCVLKVPGVHGSGRVVWPSRYPVGNDKTCTLGGLFCILSYVDTDNNVPRPGVTWLAGRSVDRVKESQETVSTRRVLALVRVVMRLTLGWCLCRRVASAC